MTDENSSTSAAPAESPAALANALEESLRRDKARRFRKGDRVHGRVYKIGETMAFVDLGGKSEGMLDLAELRRPDGSLDLTENESIEAIVVDVAANGVLLRKSLVAQDESFDQIRAAAEAGLPVQGRVTGVNKGGLEVDLFGLRAFCPASQVDVRKVDDLTPFVGESFTFRIVEVKEAGRQVVVSRRALMQDDHDRQLAEAKAKLAPGTVVKGRVTRVQPFGAFVELGEGIEGLVHVTELSRVRVSDPSQLVKPGQEVEVQVLKLEETTDKAGRRVERIALSMKALAKDPWADVAAGFPVGARVPGKVVRLQAFGAFVEVAPGVDGLVHISEIVDRRIAHPNEALKEGEEVQVTVLAVEPERKRLSLSIRGPRPAPEPRPAPAPRASPAARPAAGPKGTQPRENRTVSARGGEQPGRPPPRRERPESADKGGAAGRSQFAIGTVHEATVDKVEPFGVFVTLAAGGAAMVPNNELGVAKNADQKLDYRKVFPAGTKLRVAIIGSDRAGKLKASRVEAERADERALVKEWSTSQKPQAGGSGFGTFADLLRKANVVK